MPRLRLPVLPIRLRLALAYCTLLIVILGGAGIFVLAAFQSEVRTEADETMGLRATTVERAITDELTDALNPIEVAAAVRALGPLEEFDAPGVYVEVLDGTGKVLASTPNLPGGELPASGALVRQALAGEEAVDTVVAGHERLRVLVRPIVRHGTVIGVVLVGESLHLQDLALRDMQQSLLLSIGAAAVVALLGGWWLTSRAIGPIAQVSRVAARIAATGQLERRITGHPARDEVGELVDTFNDMLARLERTFVRQREFLADASHELRGPLMVIRGNLDLLKMNLSRADREESVQEALEEVERMTRLVSDLLFLSEADARHVVEHRQVALDEVVAQVWEQARALDAGAHAVTLERNDRVLVEGDRERLVQLVWNLVENALRYTPAGGRVTLALQRHGGVAELTVADTGIGIPPEHLPLVFQRFYRVDRARSRSQGGTGLGLAIVRQVTEAHRGQVRVRSTEGAGTVFTVALPLDTAPEPAPPTPVAESTPNAGR